MSWLTKAVALLAIGLAIGCSSPDAPKPTPVEDQGVKEPLTGLPEAPPLGAPRAKVAPKSVLPKDEE